MLSARECEVIRWIAEGKTAWEVGEILGISKRTVEWHLKSVRLKANATNITHAAVHYVRRGVIGIWGAGLGCAAIAEAIWSPHSYMGLWKAMLGGLIA